MPFFKSIPKEQVEYLNPTEDSIQLGEEYLKKVLSEKQADWLPTHCTCDFGKRWHSCPLEFQTHCYITKIRGYNSVNIKNGHRILEIRRPRSWVSVSFVWFHGWRYKIIVSNGRIAQSFVLKHRGFLKDHFAYSTMRSKNHKVSWRIFEGSYDLA